MKSGLRYRRSVCFSGIAALLFATALPAGLAQVVQSSRSSEATFEVNARLVVLDVVVTDVHGKPVDTLTQKDFQVYEDGQLQTIRSLEPPSVHSLPASSIAAGAAQRFDPAAPEAFGVSPVNVLLLDEANTHFADSSFARRQIHDYLARQPALLPQPTTLLSIYDGHFRQLQGFTRDRDALLRALASAPTEYAWKLEINGSTEDGPIERLDQSLRALNTIAQDYARIPGRKNLIWVGGGFPTLDPASIDGADAEEVKNALEHTTDVLLETRITLYAVDPASLAAGLTEITDSSQLAFATAAGDSMAAGWARLQAAASCAAGTMSLSGSPIPSASETSSTPSPTLRAQPARRQRAIARLGSSACGRDSPPPRAPVTTRAPGRRRHPPIPRPTT
jgi:VWFA-related protein